jgi:plasmid stabilization system protein ParE
MRITWSRRAHRELDAVLAFIAQDNPQAAEEIVEKIMHAVRMLADFPQMGKQTMDPKFRSLAVAGTRYIVYYRLLEEEERIQVDHVLHGAQIIFPR